MQTSRTTTNGNVPPHGGPRSTSYRQHAPRCLPSARWRVPPFWWLRREGGQAVSRCELRLRTARTACFLPHSTRPVSLAGRAHAQGEGEHAARMPLPCHESQRESTGCSKLNVAVHTRQRRGWLCSTLRVCARTCCRLAAGAGIDRLGAPGGRVRARCHCGRPCVLVRTWRSRLVNITWCGCHSANLCDRNTPGVCPHACGSLGGAPGDAHSDPARARAPNSCF